MSCKKEGLGEILGVKISGEDDVFLFTVVIDCVCTVTQIIRMKFLSHVVWYVFLRGDLQNRFICVEYFFKFEFILIGYYLPNDDGEFYQFCYVTHKGEIRGASTPFQFRTSSPVEELLTMEDEGNSDMLVVTTKAGLLEVWFSIS